MDSCGQMGVNVTVYVVLLVDKEFDLFCGGVLTSKEEAVLQGELIMEYDESIDHFIVQSEELSEKAEI
jgi:hypothetical protein